MNTCQFKNLELEISNPCNEHCLHCYRDCLNKRKEFMTVKMVTNVLEQAIKLGVSNVVITGGEVLLNPQWQLICKIIDSFGLRFSILTNGTLMTEKDIDYIKTLINLRQVQISLYAIDEDTHDKITGLKGSCKKTKDAISLLRDRNIPLFVSCPAMQENKDFFPDVMRKMNSENINNCIDLMIFGSSDYKGDNLKHCLTVKDINNFFSVAMENRGELAYIFKKSNPVCLSQISFYGGATQNLCIGADGTIYPMIGWYEPLGNIRENSLKEIFYDNLLLKKIRTIKAQDIPECTVCTASDFCGFCPTTHLTANHGELYKLNKTYCKYVHLIKQLAKQRDDILEALEKKEDLNVL